MSAEYRCGACRSVGLHEHRCEGFPCRCSDCLIECSRCGAEAPEWQTDLDAWVWSPPRPDDGLPEVVCAACQEKEAAWERSVGLDQPPAHNTSGGKDRG